MKASEILFLSVLALALATPAAWSQTTKPEIDDISMVPTRLTIRSELGVTNVIEHAAALATNQWLVLTNLVVTNSPYVVVDLAAPATKRFYRVVIPGDTNAPPDTNAPSGMALIPAGSFQMGDTFNDWNPALGTNPEIPVHTVSVSAFYMDKYEVTKALWDEVKTWAMAHGYNFENPGLGKATNHPVHTVSWYDAVKWCNARSEKEGRVPAYYTDVAQTTIYRTGQSDVQNDWVKWNTGYRLPTEAEWQKAAQGGASGQRFPWGDTITHSQANYSSSSKYSYDVSSTRGYHPDYQSPGQPYTSPVGSFEANGYGLYDMAGNVYERCWDWYGGAYSSGSQTDPRGPASGEYRVLCGGSWYTNAYYCRVALRSNSGRPGYVFTYMGFRSVLPPVQ